MLRITQRVRGNLLSKLNLLAKEAWCHLVLDWRLGEFCDLDRGSVIFLMRFGFKF